MGERQRHHRVVVIGGGNAGLSVAGRLRRSGVRDVVVIEPQERHLYKPLFSHIAGGTARASMAVRDQRAVTPRGVRWVHDSVTAIDPAASSVELATGTRLTYEQLIVCPGIQKDWDAIPGLRDAMASPFGASNYEFDLAIKASSLLRDMRAGTVVFSQPPGPASCAGAGQKPMYLACDYWRAIGVLDDIRVVMIVPDESVFGITEIDRELERKIREYGIELRTRSRIVEVDAEDRIVALREDGAATVERLAYDVLMVEPPQSAPDWLASTGLTAPRESGGFIEVDHETLRHARSPQRVGPRGRRGHHQLEVGWSAARADADRREERGRRTPRRPTDSALRRLLGVPVHGVAVDRRVRRVRRPRCAEADCSVLGRGWRASSASPGCSTATSCPGSTGT